MSTEHLIPEDLRSLYRVREWRIVVDDTEYVAPTHLVDCFKGRVALELEWNNKDPFFDRDLTT